MGPRQFAVFAGISYLVIFFAAIFANFFVLETILREPVTTITHNGAYVRLGAIAFLIAAVFDVFVAWALYELYKNHALANLSMYFRLIHATIMGFAVFTLPPTLLMSSAEEILAQITHFNTIWLIGLFFFGIHLILLGRIVKHIRYISWLLVLAGVMYVADTCAHFLLPNYDAYADVFLMLVAAPAILGEMSFSLWLLFKEERSSAKMT